MPVPDADPWHKRAVRVAARDEARLDRLFAQTAAVPHEPQWTDLRHHVSPSFAGIGWRHGKTPAEVRVLADALSRAAHTWDPPGVSEWDVAPSWTGHGVTLTSVWERTTGGLRSVAAQRVGALDWGRAAAAIDAGMDVNTAVEVLVHEQAVTSSGGAVEPGQYPDLLTCLRAGMDVPAAFEHVCGGRDMGPVRLLAALTG